MIAIQISEKQIQRLMDAVGKAKKSFPREIAATINKAAKMTKTKIGRDVRDRIDLNKKESDKTLKIGKTATAESPVSIVSLGKSKPERLGLRHFKARQDARGVSYKISKTGGRQRIEGGFQGPRPGLMKVKWKGNVFIRVGKSRLPIRHVRGVSPYAVYAKNELSGPQVKLIQEILRNEMERRINFNILRANGLIQH